MHFSGATHEDELSRAIMLHLRGESGVRERDLVRFMSDRFQLDTDDVKDMVSWLIQENQIVVRNSTRGNRLYPKSSGFGIRPILPPGV